MNGTIGRCAAAVLLGLAVPLPASAAAHLIAEYAPGAAYTVAAHCDPGAPLAIVNLVVRNTGDSDAKARTANAVDAAGMLGGRATVDPIDAGDRLSVALPLARIPGAAGPLGGAHTLAVAVGTRALPPLTVTLPAGFCDPPPAAAPAGPPAPAVVPGAGTVTRVGTTQRAIVRPIVAASPAAAATVSERRRTALNLALAIAPPSNLHGATGGPECAAHSGLAGAFVCTDMVASGNLLLVFDWKADAGPDAIDGYRAYRVDGGRHQLIAGTTNGKDLTLIDLAKPAGGYAGACYAVAAYHGAKESAPSDAFCASGGSVAKTLRLTPQYVRSSNREDASQGNFVTGHFSISQAPAPIQVGFHHEVQKHTLGDGWYNFVSRAGVAFDVSPLAHHKLVSAKLKMTILSSAGYGNNRSCATDVGTGTEFWWRNSDWIDASFGAGVVPTDTGPIVSADVTTLVAPWLTGEPNYGFVLRNADENVRAFAENQCVTSYGAPTLELTYY